MSARQLRLVAVMQGSAFGIKHPTLVANVIISKTQISNWPKLDQSIKLITQNAPVQDSDQALTDITRFASRVAHLTVDAMQKAGLAVFDNGRLLGARKSGTNDIVFSLALPYVAGASSHCFETLTWATNFLWSLIDSNCHPETVLVGKKRQSELITQLEKWRLQGTNPLRFLEAANEAGIPYHLISNVCCQYGWGWRQAWGNSSIFDSTSCMAVSLARNKQTCAHVLRQAGLPVPDHGVATSLDQAKKIAHILGYPVVIKPVNLDGGIGVAAGLQSEEQLEQAWGQTIKHSQTILVEKHQYGDDYRLIVFDDQLIWAVKRQPAGVTGNGQLSIAQLVDKSNQDPRRGYHAAATLRPLQLDDEAMNLLAEQRCTTNTVLPDGRFVHLRRAANVSSGGTPLVVTDRVHPDNRQLVERAVKLLRLDLAGVDLIIPDIEVSWRDSGGVIIEVNAQPQLVAASQNHLYTTILKARVSGDGRIPVVVVLGEDGQSFAEAVVSSLLLISASSVGLASRGGSWIGNKVVGRAGLSAFEAARALLLQRDTEALLLVIDDESILKTGLPVDYYDTLVVVAPESANADACPSWLPNALTMIAPNCNGDVLFSAKILMTNLRQPNSKILPKPRVVTSPEELLMQVTENISAGLSRNGQFERRSS
jgi:cyanophycin synthetase